jgi:hypothetical protein
VDAEVSKQRGQMNFDGSLAEPQSSRDLLVRIALHNECENIFLPGVRVGARSDTAVTAIASAEPVMLQLAIEGGT